MGKNTNNGEQRRSLGARWGGTPTTAEEAADYTNAAVGVSPTAEGLAILLLAFYFSCWYAFA